MYCDTNCSLLQPAVVTEPCHEHKYLSCLLKEKRYASWYLIAAGLASCAVQWGAWHGVGMVAANASVLARMRRAGIATVGPAAGLSVLQQLLSGPPRASHVSGAIVMSCVICVAVQIVTA